MRSVGVMGDFRTYDYTLALRAVRTNDFMTCEYARLPHEPAEPYVLPHHQRGAGREPRGVRYHRQAPGND